MLLSQTSVDGLSIPVRPAHGAMIYWTPARLAQAQQWFATHPFTITPKPSLYMPWADIFLHYQMTGNAADCTSAYTLFSNPNLIIVKNSKGYQGIASDAARYWGELSILTYDWCYNAFTPAQRSNLRNVINNWVSGWMNAWWGNNSMSYNNYFWGYLRNELEWGIASYNDQPAQATVFLDDVLGPNGRWNAFKANALAAQNSGVPIEGSQYGKYQLHYPLLPFLSAADYGRNLYSETNWFRDAVFYLIYTTTDAPTTIKGTTKPNYEDISYNDDQFWNNGGSALSPIGNGAIGSYYGDFALLMANLETPAVAGMAKQWLATVAPPAEKFWSSADSSANVQPTSFTTLAPDFYAPGPEVAFSRSAWGGTMLYTRFGGIIGSGHWHQDSGTFELWANGKFATRESVGYGSTFTGYAGQGTVQSWQTLPHNTVVYNGVGQSVAPDGASTVDRLESTAGYFYESADMTQSYHCSLCVRWNVHLNRNNPAVAHAEREFLFLRPLSALLVFDRLQSTMATDVKTETFACEVPWVLEDATHESCNNGPTVLRITNLLTPSAVRSINESGCPTCSKNGQYRLEIDTIGAIQSYGVNVLDTHAAGAGNLVASMVDSNPTDPTSGTFTISVGSSTVVLNKGASSSGGVVDGRALGNSVQPMMVTDNGPIWQ